MNFDSKIVIIFKAIILEGSEEKKKEQEKNQNTNSVSANIYNPSPIKTNGVIRFPNFRNRFPING